MTIIDAFAGLGLAICATVVLRYVYGVVPGARAAAHRSLPYTLGLVAVLAAALAAHDVVHGSVLRGVGYVVIAVGMAVWCARTWGVKRP